MVIELFGWYARGQVALADDADHALVAGTRWYRTRTGYAWGRVGGSMTLLHRHLLAAAPGVLVDHVNGDRLDCRRQNLRLATPAQNKANSRRRADSRLPFKGIERTRSGRYRAVLTVAGRRYRSGTFAEPLEAARAYDAMACRQWGPAFVRANSVTVRAGAVVRWAGGHGRMTADPQAVTGSRVCREVVAENESNLLLATPRRG